MPWLLRGDDEVLASAEVASSRRARRTGLLGRDGIEGVLVLERVKSVHTLGLRFSIDVAHVAGDGTVLRTTTMRPGRIGALVWRAAQVIEAEAGTFARWELRAGQQVQVCASKPDAGLDDGPDDRDVSGGADR